jgi:hypothetical protein
MFEGSRHGRAPALCAVTSIDDEFRKKYPNVWQRFMNLIEAWPELKTFIHDPSKLTKFSSWAKLRRSPRSIVDGPWRSVSECRSKVQYTNHVLSSTLMVFRKQKVNSFRASGSRQNEMGILYNGKTL